MAALMMVLGCLGFAPALGRPPIAATRTRVAAPVALFGAPRALEFDEINLQQCTSYLRSFPNKFRGWGEAEWRQFALPPLQFSTRPVEGGVALVYFLSEEKARASGRGSAAVEDGGALEITVAAGGDGFLAPGPRIALRSKKGSLDRSRQEAVIVARLADECASSATAFGTLSSRSWRPPRGTVAKLDKLAGACMYDKAVRKRY